MWWSVLTQRYVGQVSFPIPRSIDVRTDAITVCVQDTNLLIINQREEILDLLDLVRLIVILLGNRGVGLGVDLTGLELFRHVVLRGA